MFVLLIMFYLIPFIIVLWALVDILRNEFDPQQNKIIWVLVVVLLPVMGSILYFFIGRSQKRSTY